MNRKETPEKSDPNSLDQSANQLAALFEDNFDQFVELTSKAICQAGPISTEENSRFLASL